MISSQFSVSHGGADSSKGMSPGRTVGTVPSQADLQFWQDVFDGAKGIGVDADATLMTDVGSVVSSQQRPSTSTVAQQAGARTGAFAPGSMSAVHGDPFALAQQDGAVGVRLASPTLIARVGVAPSIAAGVAYGGGDDTASASVDKAPKVSVEVAYDDAAVETSLKAHAVQTPDGDWKVTLRTSKKLSVAQALSAVVEALNRDGLPQGQVDQVVLNGTCIYQQNNRSGASASTNFEWQC